ncbi:MAG: GIY-YIG nuclease family protein [Candidatus Buchananbacteria bacterium]|nr:GIY-YIG nuclease family protein [Candidatus Buchananbacteria bacterium]
MYYVYFILLSNKDVYKGFTDNVKRRWDEHRAGKVLSTANCKP